jgi:hypothetical protein
VHHVIYVHTHKIVALIGCIDIRGSLRFSSKVCKMTSLDQIEIPFNMHIFRGNQFFMYESKMLIEYSLKDLIKVYHQPPKRGRLKVHLSP